METLIDQLQTAPMENSGFEDALRRQCDALGYRTGATVTLTIGALPPSTALVPGAYEALYRFAQEALHNVGRHARASTVKVHFGVRAGRLELWIADDGRVSFRMKPSGMGGGIWRLAHKIGGTCMITSTRGSGITVMCAVPLGARSVLRRVGGALAWAASADGGVPAVLGRWRQQSGQAGVLLRSRVSEGLRDCGGHRCGAHRDWWSGTRRRQIRRAASQGSQSTCRSRSPSLTITASSVAVCRPTSSPFPT